MSDVLSALIERLVKLEAEVARLKAQELNLPAGAASAPAVTLAGDTNTGIWQSAADNLDFATGGTNRLNISSAGLGVAGAVSATTSLISGINSTAAGMLTVYGPGASNTEGGQIDIYPGSSYQSVISKWSIDVYADDLRFFGTGGTVNLLLQAEGPVQLGHAGTALLPALTWGGDLNTGIYRSAADNLDFSTGGTNRLNISSAGVVPGSNETQSLGTDAREWKDVWALDTTINHSDLRDKTDLDDSLGIEFIRLLRPRSWRWNTELVKGKRRHSGLVAQDVLAALTTLGVSTSDFAGYVYSPNTQKHYLRLGEFIGPIVKAVQDLDQRLTILERGQGGIDGRP